MLRRHGTLATGRQQGLSLVELMIGIALGLFIMSSAGFVMSNQLADNRRMMLETQIQQELRGAADLIARDIRRAGFWTNASRGILLPSGAAPSNPYAGLDADRLNAKLEFAYSADPKYENDNLDGNERAGFRLAGDIIQMQLGSGGVWQPVTDANLIKITTFDLALNTEVIDLLPYCQNPCPSGTSCTPTQTVRSITVTLKGTAAHDPSVSRTLRTTVRLRNDIMTGACP
jgi:type IV pilus assembly protein PilW